MAWYESRGQRLHYESVGEGPAVVMLHGFSNFAGNWAPQLPDLVYAGYRVLLPDLAGHGLSQPAERVTTVPDLAADIAALLESLDIARAAVCGLSLGGMVAQQLAVLYPQRVAALFIADSDLRFDTPAGQAAVAGWVRLLEQPEGAVRRHEAAWPLLVSEAFRVSGAGQAAYETWRRVAARLPGRSLIQVAWGMSQFNLEAELTAVRAPALVVAGSDDRLIPPERGRQIAARIAGARFAEIPGAAHIPNLDSPGEFTRMLLDFLATDFR